MITEVIRGEPRQAGGRTAINRLRKAGWVPAVVYGHGQPAESVSLSKDDVKNAIEAKRKVVKVEINGQSDAYLLKEVQFDHYQIDPLHIDLMRVDMTERVHIKVPIEFVGEAKGVKEGGNLLTQLNAIEVECSLVDTPDSIRVTLTDLAISQSVHVKDVALPENVTAVHPDDLIASVQAKRGTTAAELGEGEEGEEGGEGGSEPEVIGRGKGEEEE